MCKQYKEIFMRCFIFYFSNKAKIRGAFTHISIQTLNLHQKYLTCIWGL